MPVQSWRALIVALFAGGLLAGVLAAQGNRGNVDPATLGNPVPATAEAIADGAALFTGRCAAGHGADQTTMDMDSRKPSVTRLRRYADDGGTGRTTGDGQSALW